MKKESVLMKIIVALSLVVLLGSAATAGDGDTPGAPAPEKKTEPAEDTVSVTLRASLMSPLFYDFPAAMVNDEVITLDELKNALVLSHVPDMEKTQKARKIDFQVFLDRLISIRLITQEARNIGLDELPEIKDGLEKFAETTLRQLYVAELVKDLKADEAEIDALYKENIKEWKIRSLMFSKEENAKKMEAVLQQGKSFEEAAAHALQEGSAKGPDKADWVRVKTLQKEVAETVGKMKIGSVSPVLTLGAGKVQTYSLIKLEEARDADDPAEREKAERQVSGDKRQKFLEQYKKDLYKKYARINRKLLAGIDYEAKKPGLEKLAKDKRIVAELPGKRITVGDLTAALKDSFFHGADTAAQSKKINREKKYALEETIDRLLLKQEAIKHGIDKTRQYKALVKEFETDMLFSAFVGRVIGP